MTWTELLRGTFKSHEVLSSHTWFRVGGACLGMFHPLDVEDFRKFMQNVPGPYRILGAGSNVLIHDEGWPGFIVKLHKGFRHVLVEGTRLRVGAGALDRVVAQVAQKCGLSGIEFLYTIPGSIGGALALNAGCYGQEIANIVEEVTMMTPQGELHVMKPEELNYAYRHCEIPEGWVFIEAVLSCVASDSASVARLMHMYAKQRQDTQPIQVRTGGSTFKNPPQSYAWQWIHSVGGRGARLGDAQFSEKHCNFLINLGHSNAQELWALGTDIQARVRLAHHIQLEWEIKVWDDVLFKRTSQTMYGLRASIV